jgi:citrate synthase
VTEKGLREVVAAATSISDIDGARGRLWYVGYEIQDLAKNATFEETVHLLHRLHLPNRAELDELTDFMVEEREVSRFLRDLMPTLAQQTSPMSMLRTSVSAASAYDPDGWDNSAEANERKAFRRSRRRPPARDVPRMRTGRDVVRRTQRRTRPTPAMLLEEGRPRRTRTSSTRRSRSAPTTR